MTQGPTEETAIDRLLHGETAATIMVLSLVIAILEVHGLAEKRMIADMIREAADKLPDEESPYGMKRSLLKIHRVLSGDDPVVMLMH